MHGFPKPEPAQRDDDYLAWIRSQRSVESGDRFCVAHHVVGDRCSTLKTSDYLAIPLTDAEHKRLHDEGWPAWEARCGPQRAHSAAMLDRAIGLGLFKPDRKAMKRAMQSEAYAE